MPKIHVHTAFNLLLSPTAPRVHFDAGVHDVSDEVAEHWYTREHASVIGAEQPVPAEAEADEFDAKTDDELRAFIKDRDGKSPHPRTSREKLLKAARGDAAASAEAEADEGGETDPPADPAPTENVPAAEADTAEPQP